MFWDFGTFSPIANNHETSYLECIFFKCRFKLLSTLNFPPHSLHEKIFSVECVTLWRVSMLFVEKHFPQCPHWKSVECDFTWRANPSLDLKLFSHIAHSWETPQSFFWWLRNNFALKNAREQTSHLDFLVSGACTAAFSLTDSSLHFYNKRTKWPKVYHFILDQKVCFSFV